MAVVAGCRHRVEALCDRFSLKPVVEPLMTRPAAQGREHEFPWQRSCRSRPSEAERRLAARLLPDTERVNNGRIGREAHIPVKFAFRVNRSYERQFCGSGGLQKLAAQRLTG